MNTDRWFPIMAGAPNHIRRIPWGVIAPHEEQARRNHSQSLERLAERGGLGCVEAVAVLTDSRFPYEEMATITTGEQRSAWLGKYDKQLRELVDKTILDAVFTPLEKG